ncbi:MAG: nucleotidyl transferase AbiEii/AbiGii toxin family protein [Opitutaceae bacterium]
MWSDRQAIELFHLIFVANLGRRVDKAFFVIKGGSNLRFFCRSIRYSEDIDFDVRTMAKATLENNVATILKSAAFAQALRTKQIEVEHVTSDKQTDTTQRWKFGIRLAGGPAMPTKVEFSRRHGLDDDQLLEPVDAELVRTYELYPILAQHYSREAAFRQKIGALSGRTVTQARDIFDLKQLLDGGAGREKLSADTAAKIPRAIENAMTVGFDEFSGQVRAYLMADYQEYYGSRKVWETLQHEVVNALERLQS